MRHDRLLILGGFLASAMIAAGCGSSTSSTDSGAAGKGGSGGGSGGSGMDAGLDHGSLPDVGSDTSGSGGKMDANLDVAQDHTTGAGGSNDAAVDTATDVPMDTVADSAPHDAGPCVTNYGAGNQVLFNAFNGGVNDGWYKFMQDPNTTGLTTSLGFSVTEGHNCPGSLLLGVNFATYGTGVAGFIETFFGTSPGGANWTPYKALHAWIKAESATLSELNGVYFYVKSGNQVFYQNDFAAGANLADWQQVVIDLTRAPNGGNGVMINDVQVMGFEALLNTAPAVGAPANPSQLQLLVDDIWLEAAPPVDSGTSDAHATDGSGQ